MNPATWMLEILSKDNNYPQVWQNSAASRIKIEELGRVQHLIEPGPNEFTFNAADYVVPISRQLKWVYARAFRSNWRDPITNLGRFITLIFVVLIFSIVFVQITADDYGSINSKIAAISVINGFVAFGSGLLTLPNTIADRAIYYRERASNSYPSWI